MTEITLDNLLHTPQGDLAALPPQKLAQLLEEAKFKRDNYKLLHERVQGIVNFKYRDSFNHNRVAQEKETGLIRIEDDNYIIAQDITKKTDWDKKKLAEIIEKIKSQGDDPAEYVDVLYKVSEHKFKSWPSFIRKVFEPARTIKHGKPTYTLTPKTEDA
jgi:hypothetical protein